MQPYSLLNLGGNNNLDASNVNANSSTLSWLTQVNQFNSSGSLPGTTVMNIGQVIQINGNQDYILISTTSGIAQLVMGSLPDGSVGMVVAKQGVSVLSLFS